MHDRNQNDELAEDGLHVAAGLFRDIAPFYDRIYQLFMQDSDRAGEVDHSQELEVIHPVVIIVSKECQGRSDVTQEAREQVLQSNLIETVFWSDARVKRCDKLEDNVYHPDNIDTHLQCLGAILNDFF